MSIVSNIPTLRDDRSFVKVPDQDYSVNEQWDNLNKSAVEIPNFPSVPSHIIN